MAEKVEKVEVSLDELTISDLERIESGNISDMLPVFDRLVLIPGVDKKDIPEKIRGLHWSMLSKIGNAIQEAVAKETENLGEGGGSKQS